MEFTFGISLAAIKDLTQKEYKNKESIGILSTALIAISILVLGFLAPAQLTRSNDTSSQNTQESHCRCGSKCSCGPACGCH